MAASHDDSKALITGFRLSHQSLVDSIAQIQLSLRSYSQAKPKLREFYSNLHNHFARQDQKFYDRLALYYADDRPATKMLDFLTHDLKDLKVKYLVFSDQHTGEMGPGHPRRFPLEFTEFASQILARIKIEDEYLLPLVEKLR
jgi:hypothetical protein